MISNLYQFLSSFLWRTSKELHQTKRNQLFLDHLRIQIKVMEIATSPCQIETKFKCKLNLNIPKIKIIPKFALKFNNGITHCLKTPKVFRSPLHCRGWHHLNFWVNINQNWAYEKNWRKEGEIMNLFLNFYWMYL